MLSDEAYNEWTSCEFYGCNYEQDDDDKNRFRCTDCGDVYFD